MEEDQVFTKRFIDCIRKPLDDRAEQDVEFICHTLKKLSEFKGYDQATLRATSQRLVYELHNKDTILFSPGDKAECWFYVLTGSVMLSMNYFFSTGSSFGQCVNEDARDDQCHILEDTQLLRINYTEAELKTFASRAAKMANKLLQTSNTEDTNGLSFSAGGSSISTLAASTRDESTSSPEQNQMRTESQRPPEAAQTANVAGSNSLAMRFSPDRKEALDLEMICPINEAPLPRREDRGPPLSADILEHHRRSKSEERVFSFDPSDMKKISVSTDSLDKAMEDPVMPTHSIPAPSTSEVSVRRRKDRERRYSAPPSERRNTRDSVGSLDYLSESQVDSDDEDSVQSESSSAASMDAVFEVLSKPSADRTEEDIERVMDVLQYMPVFSNLTSNIRRALFQVLTLQSLDCENSLVMDNGEEVNKWYVVLNGQLKLVRESDGDKFYHVGDCFGVSQSLKILPHRGKLVTAEKGCTICYCSAEEYGQIMTQGEENMKRVIEDGKVVAVLEKRAVNAKREGYFVIQATPETLLNYLVEEGIDDTFHKDFLLTYRTFLKDPLPLIDKLKEAWQAGLPDQRERIVKIVLYWVSEHFPDFEENDKMTEFMDWFEERLKEDGKVGEKRALDKARTDFPRIRHVELARPGTNAPLNFTVVGGWAVGYPSLISEVEPNSVPAEAGLRVGDMILEINDNKCDKKTQEEVVSILRKNFKLSLKVRSNLPEFKQYMANPPKPPPEQAKKPMPGPMLAHVPMARCNSVDSRPTKDGPSKATKMPGSPKAKKRAPKILTQLGKFSSDQFKKLKFTSRTSSTSSMVSDTTDGGSGPLKAKRKMPSRKASQENLLDDGGGKPSGPMRASSLEDIHSLSKQKQSGRTGLSAKIVDGAVKLYSPDHTHKYVDVSPTSTISDLILRGVKEFYPDKFVANPTDEYCICMVSVTSRNGPIRNSVLPNHLADLANFLALESRYYLKARAFHGTLVQDEEADQIFRESRQWEAITNLSPKQVAEQLTRQDSEVFCTIDASEYIADLWRDPNKSSKKNLEKFENIPNDEMYWVVTTVISETRSEIRAKLIKHFIKIAKWCKEQNNFNSMFHILSGLNHGLVQRQRSTWEKVPSKYRKSMDDLTGFMNPFHNMAKYRELQRSTTPPLIPFFPILKKDLTFLYDGNETQVDGLVNFEKLRMLSQQIRVIKHYCQQTIMPAPPQVDLGRLGGVLKSIHHSIRLRNRHNPATLATITDNALKDVFNHHRMMKMVRRHLERKYVVQEEELLERIAESTEKVVQLRRNPPSPLSKGKRKSGHHEKHKSNPFSTISPSPTANSISSDTSAPNVEHLSTPPISPRKLSAPALTGSYLTSDPASGESSEQTPKLETSNANGIAPPQLDTPV